MERKRSAALIAVTEERRNEVLSAAYDAWKQECEIVRNEDAIAAAIGDTAAEILE